jgi:hypothetical protein
MSARPYETIHAFQHEVAKLLELPTDCSDADVRKALLAKGMDYIAWYNTRLEGIKESCQTPKSNVQPIPRSKVGRPQ